tara:strand:+ start:467 stop:733 length:267 start_codon:yes stop_codon:yes gene_type:complete
MSKKKESHGMLGGNLADVHMSKDQADVAIQLNDEKRFYQRERFNINRSIGMREDILSDIWSANKKVVDGKWYIELSQVCEIIGGSNGE